MNFSFFFLMRYAQNTLQFCAILVSFLILAPHVMVRMPLIIIWPMIEYFHAHELLRQIEGKNYHFKVIIYRRFSMSEDVLLHALNLPLGKITIEISRLGRNCREAVAFP